jgi:hypothetical protein
MKGAQLNVSCSWVRAAAGKQELMNFCRLLLGLSLQEACRLPLAQLPAGPSRSQLRHRQLLLPLQELHPQLAL